MNAFNIFAYHSGLSRIILQNGLTEKTKCIVRISRLMSTINVRDIEYHDNLSEIWWNDSDTLRALHRFNRVRMPFIREGLASTGYEVQNPRFPLQAIKIADVGCGGGILTESLARAGADVTGIDASEKLINVAKRHIQLESDIVERVNYINTSIEEFSQKNEKTYDAIVASEIVEHVENPDVFLKECIKILRPSGSIFITTPNKTLLSWLGGIVISEYILNIVPRGTHDWNKFIPAHKIQRMLDNYGCRTISVQGLIYDPICSRWSWSSSTEFCYAVHAIKRKEKDTYNNSIKKSNSLN